MQSFENMPNVGDLDYPFGKFNFYGLRSIGYLNDHLFPFLLSKVKFPDSINVEGLFFIRIAYEL